LNVETVESIFDKDRGLPEILALGGLIGAGTGIGALFLTVLQRKLFGSVVFFWGEGCTRYENARMLTNYLIWILPLGLILNSIDIF
jgi:hypothetical protein